MAFIFQGPSSNIEIRSDSRWTSEGDGLLEVKRWDEVWRNRR